MPYTPFGLPGPWEWVIACLIVLVVIPAIIVVHRHRSRKNNRVIDEVVNDLRSGPPDGTI